MSRIIKENEGMKNLIDKCKFKFYLKGEKGHQTLVVDVFYKKEWVARFNWCGGISHHKGFDVCYDGIFKRKTE